FPLSVLYNDIYIPTSSVPKAIIDKADWRFDGSNYCFSLKSPKHMEKFAAAIGEEHITFIQGTCVKEVK
ncbi:MAG: hypothetical protein RR198_08400, partial [Oscillospiraceae bacterium]